MLDERFVLLGAAFHVAGSVRYLVRTLRGDTVPNRVTWFLWALAPMVAFAAELSEGVGLRSLMTFMVGFSPAVILIASLTRRAERWQPAALDLWCGGLSLAGLVLWQLTREGNVAIALSLLADLLAAVPTVVKSHRAPETESYSVYLGAAVSAVVTLLTVERATFAELAWPIYIAVLGVALTALIARGQARHEIA